MVGNKRERNIESLLINEVGKIGGLCFKFNSGVRGVPDRIVIYNGRVYFLELKRPKGGRVSPLQQHWITTLNEHGVYANVVCTEDRVRDFIRRVTEIGEDSD